MDLQTQNEVWVWADIRGENDMLCLGLPDAKSREFRFSYTMSYEYDNLGNRTGMTIAPAGEEAHTVTYQYDYGKMVLKSITDDKIPPNKKACEYSYDDFARLQSTVYANGAQQEYNNNDNMRLKELAIWDGLGGNLASYQYRYSPGGVINSIMTFAEDLPVHEYTYDALNQITEEDVSGAEYGEDYTHQYTYDANGNRTRETRDGTTTRTYETPGSDNRLTGYTETEHAATVTFNYDPRGNRTTKTISDQPSTINYAYDAENRMTCVDDLFVGGCVEYTYDSVGRKVKRRHTGRITITDYYIYDGLDCVYERKQVAPGTFQPKRLWILRGMGVAPGVGNIIAISTTDSGQLTTDYYHPNHRGDTVFTTDETGNKRAELRYDAFGNTVYEPSAENVKYRFSGKEWDADAKLYYYGFRWYDPQTGTWTAKDPLGYLAGDFNIYRMCANSPIWLVDPYGLKWTWWKTTKAGAAAGGIVLIILFPPTGAVALAAGIVVVGVAAVDSLKEIAEEIPAPDIVGDIEKGLKKLGDDYWGRTCGQTQSTENVEVQ